MSQTLVNQITIDCLLNKELMEEHVMKQREKQINKEEFNFYKKRINQLFKDIMNNQLQSEMPPDVKYAYDTFIRASIHYFKISDNNGLLQEEYKDVEFIQNNLSEPNLEFNKNYDNNTNIEADKLLMRSVKMDAYTLDKYVKRTNLKKDDNIILTKKRDVDIMSPELKNKRL